VEGYGGREGWPAARTQAMGLMYEASRSTEPPTRISPPIPPPHPSIAPHAVAMGRRAPHTSPLQSREVCVTKTPRIEREGGGGGGWGRNHMH